MAEPAPTPENAAPAAADQTGGGQAAASAPVPRTRLQRFIRNWVVPLALAAAVMLPFRSAIADWNDVPTGSMRPTILEGDRIVVNKLAFGLRVPFTTAWIAQWSGPARGDIVTFAAPDTGDRLVKRVVGLPGDRIALTSNRLTINGVSVTQTVVDNAALERVGGGRRVPAVIAREALPGSLAAHPLTLIPGVTARSSFPEVVVPEGHYFLMGDNRDLSRDSRYFGFVAREKIYGRSSYVAVSVDPSRGYLPRLGRWFSRLR